MTQSIQPVSNVLQGIKIGSTVSESNSGFAASIVNAKITKIDPTPSTHKILTGYSNRVYADSMNSGSFGVSGSYGFSGLSSLTAQASGYLSAAQATDGRATGLNYSLFVVAGIEYIDFDNLLPKDLLASLSVSARSAALSTLDAYKDLIGSSPTDDQLGKWLASKREFDRVAGSGMVIGVMWGAYGTVSLELRSKDSSSASQYGGQASFQYSGVAASLSVSAAYDGQHKTGSDDVTKKIESSSLGNIISEDMNTWFNNANALTVDQLFSTNIDIASYAPKTNYTPPAVPQFQVPTPDPAIAAKLADLRNLNELKELSIKATEKQSLLDGSSTSEADFQEKLKLKVDTTELANFHSKVKNNDLEIPASTLSKISNGDSINELQFNESQMEELLLNNTYANENFFIAEDESTSESTSPGDKGDYTPIGVWIAKWTDLLPWLSTGILNSIKANEIDQISDILVKKTIIQDLDALRRIYYLAHDSSLLVPNSLDDSSPIDFLQIANSFSHAFASISSLTKPGINQVDNVLASMSDDSKKIYKKWAETKILRNCELGLALTYDDTHTVSFTSLSSPAMGLCQQENTESIAIDYLGEQTDNHICAYLSSKVSFTSSSTDFSVFSQTQKLLPLITPSGQILVFGAYLPTSDPSITSAPHPLGILATIVDSSTFSQTISQLNKFATDFIPDSERKLWNGMQSKIREISELPLSFVFSNDPKVLIDSSCSWRNDIDSNHVYDIELGFSTTRGWSAFAAFIVPEGEHRLRKFPSDTDNSSPTIPPANPNSPPYVVFTLDETKKFLINQDLKVKAFPVRFTAAEGSRSWIGQSSSNNVGSLKNLESQFGRTIEDLKAMSTWTFDADSWSTNWTPDTPYSLRTLKVKYLGYVEESGNVFPTNQGSSS